MVTLVLMVSGMFFGTSLYAADGDFTVDGKLGVGTTTPTEKVEVDGNVKAASFLGGPPVDYALLSQGATITGGTCGSYALDGAIYQNYNWYGAAAQNETLYHMGTIDLGQIRSISQIKFHLYDPARTYYNYKIEYSTDNTNWSTWVDRTDSGVNYSGTQIIQLSAPVNARYIKLWNSGNNYCSYMYIPEVYVY